MTKIIDSFFKLKENKTSIRTEILAGITTFVTMAYILAVNPGMLSLTGMNAGAVFTATALASAIATLLMGLWANYPIALSAGMGLNAYFTFTVCLGELKGIEDPWKIALTAVLAEGIVFLILSFFKVRETLITMIPLNLKYGITAGIGLFIGFVAFQQAGIIVSEPATLVTLGSFGHFPVILCFIGVVVITVLTHFRVRGAIILGIFSTWILGIIAELTGLYTPTASLIPAFSMSNIIPPSISTTFFAFNFTWIADNLIAFISIAFALLFVDLFDTIGFVIGLADYAGFLDKKGNLPRAGRVLTSDAVGTVVGSVLGTSTVTSYMESSAGVSAGGKTGLTSVTTGLCFVLALFLSPLFLAIPAFATAPALIFVAFNMSASIVKINFKDDIADAIGGFFSFIMMPLTYSIANGIMFGILFWVTIKVLTKKAKEIHPLLWVISLLFVIRIISLA
ncbi:NCS2 family permease [Parasporobacterium paucivorans]|uniref:Putative MFS transporter, AGZA family, xanthine/uracil permease n=1 Tax=Parasporobacterium paucivorans DSM 15970 TaxID=1122934 RepID=A0A1M6AA75_9FIRM|nr:NCS2 family permease [Parasporobacterium paucivorans]SHI33372.1 putative MFS transporter, AGZA family, xanthine/uracil permease [Parasporobacterium paucivorans DSM 15970]